MRLVKQNRSKDSDTTSKPITQELIEECFLSLQEKKSQLLNQNFAMRQEYQGRDPSGDEVDQSLAVLAENHFLARQEHIIQQLTEIEFALARIEQGAFGICEETEEYIEPNRLRAIPWTRLSIEGAELREALKKRFVK